MIVDSQQGCEHPVCHWMTFCCQHLKFSPLNNSILEVYGKFFPATIAKATTGRSAVRVVSAGAMGVACPTIDEERSCGEISLIFGLKIVGILGLKTAKFGRKVANS